MDEFINITSSVQQPKQKSVEQLLELINKNVNRKGTEQNKRLDIVEKDTTKILKAITKLNTRQEKAQTKKEKEEKDEETLRDKWNKFLDKSQDFFENPAKMLGEKFGLVGKALAAPLKLLSKSLSLLKRDDDTDGVKSQEESKEVAKEQKKESIWDRFRAFVGEKLTLIGDKLSIKDKLVAAREKLGNFGLLGKTAKALLKFIPWVFSSLVKVVWPLLQKIVLPVVKTLLWPVIKLGGLIGKGLSFVFGGIGKVIFGAIKALAGIVGWPALIIAGIAALGALIYTYWDEIKEAFSDFFEWLCDIPGSIWKYVRSLLPSWLGGMSDEEKAQYEKDSATKDELKKKGVKRADRNAYLEEQEKRRKAGLDEQSYDEWQSKRVLSGERKGAVVADSKEARQLAREQANKKTANVIKQAETSSAKPEKIEKPETPESDNSKKEQPKAVEKTVIIKETQAGAEVADYIGTASSVVLNMTRT